MWRRKQEMLHGGDYEKIKTERGSKKSEINRSKMKILSTEK